MGFVLTLLYIAITLLSPMVLPQAIWSLHVSVIIGVLLILALIPSFGQSKLGSTPETYLALGLLIATSASILVTGWVGGATKIIFGFSPVLLTFLFVAVACRSIRRLNILVAVLTVVMLFVFFQGAHAYFSGNFESDYLRPEGTPAGYIYRWCGLGVISDPNDLAQVFVTTIPLLWIWWKPGRFIGNFLFTIVPAVLLTLGVYYTHSRGGVVALIAILLFGFKDKLGFVKSSIFAGIALAGLLALNISGGRGMNDDDGGRVAAWVTGLEIFKVHPLFGIGVENFSDYNETGATAHNSYVLCLAELGIFGYFFWMGMIVSGWSGLSGIIRTESSGTPALESGDHSGEGPPKDELGNFAEPWLRGHEVNQVAVPVGAGGAVLSRSAVYAPVRNDVETRSPYHVGEIVDEQVKTLSAEDEVLVRAAKVVRVGFVGMLTAAFFISRTYSVILYVMLGIAAALKLIYRERHPEVKSDVKSLMKRTWLVILGSVVFLYLFVRLHGVR